MTDPALKAAVERVTALATDCEYAAMPTKPDVVTLCGWSAGQARDDLRTLLDALSSQDSVMEAMAKAADGVIAVEDAARETLKRVGLPIKLTPEIDTLRTALSQYRTLGDRHDD